MRFSVLLSVFGLAALASAAAIPVGKRDKGDLVHIQHDDMDETPGSGGDMVVIVDNDDPRTIPQLIRDLGSNSTKVKYIYDNAHFKGFAATMSKHCVSKLSTFSGVKHYEEKIHFTTQGLVQQTDTTWGLGRISKPGPIGISTASEAVQLKFPYTFDDSAGLGVDIYIVDTGTEYVSPRLFSEVDVCLLTTACLQCEPH